MKKLVNDSVSNYISALARTVAVPGGGSGAALVGALGTALLEMSMGYSAFSEGRLRLMTRVRLRLLKLVDEDARAYEEVAQSRKGSWTEKKKSLEKATEIPMRIHRNCERALILAKRWSRRIKPALKSDWQAGQSFLQAAKKAAVLHVTQNLKSLKQLSYARRTTHNAQRS